jgi:hypothetical protein
MPAYTQAAPVSTPRKAPRDDVRQRSEWRAEGNTDRGHLVFHDDVDDVRRALDHES